MHRYFLSIRTFSLILTAVAVVFVAGCGGSGGSGGGDEITVQTGTLSKAEFIKRADAICAAGRNQFNREYTSFLEENQAVIQKASTPSTQSAVTTELVETILLPSYEKWIKEVSTIGAPAGDEKEVAAFLNALQGRLDQIQAQPSELSKSATPFAKPAKLAVSYGLTGCAEAIS